MYQVIYAVANQFPACVSEVTRVRPKHYGILCDQLNPLATEWENLAGRLGFQRSEINHIKANTSSAYRASFCYLEAVIDKWTHWAPNDARGSKNFAILEHLKAVIEEMGYPKIADKLALDE